MNSARPLPGGPATRLRAAGVAAGSPLTRVRGGGDALASVASELGEAEVALARLLGSDVGAVPAVSGHLAAAGGKRLRPALTALGARAVGFEGDLPGLMCVGELIHLGSLLHDDVVDQADRRRGLPAAHTVYGNAVAVLTGDFCLARAIWLAAEVGGHRAVTRLGAAVTQMAEGEVLQLQRAGNLASTREDYLEVVERKSAALIAWCAAAGAYAVGDTAAAEALERFGHAVGVAFQITDDVLDYAEGTGKEAGVDLRERKVTLPLLLAFDRVPGLRERLAAGEPTDAELPELMQIVRGSGALEDALEEARRLAVSGVEAIGSLPASPATEALEGLAWMLVERAR
jgi:octaprenyl-diphosphate synthase